MRARLDGLGVPSPRHRVVADPAEVAAFAAIRRRLPGGAQDDPRRLRRQGRLGGRRRRTAASTRSPRRRRPASRSWPRRRSTSGASCPRWSPGRPRARSRPTRWSESVQLDGICFEVTAPAPDLDEELSVAGAADRDAGRRRARRDRHPRGRAVRDPRRPGARQRAGDAAAQHRALEHGRRRHRPVREPPARRARPAARLPRRAGALDRDGQHPRRRARRAVGGPVRRLPARARARPRAQGAPVRQGP